MTSGQNSSFSNLIKVLHVEAENVGGWLTKNTAQVRKQVLEMQNGIRFIFGLLILHHWCCFFLIPVFVDI